MTRGRRRPREPMPTMTKILLVLLVTILAFVGTVLWYNFTGRLVQDSLIQWFGATCTGELVTMGGIQIFKIREEKKP